MDTPTEANARLTAFMSEVRDTGRLWVLRNDEGYAQWSSEEGVCFPVWSQRQMAERAVTSSLPDYRIEELALEAFRASCLPSLRDREIWIGVNLAGDMCGIEIPCGEFEKEIASRVA